MNQKENKKSYQYLKNNIGKANNKRRLAQMYIQLLRGSDKNYSENDILEVYQYVISENHKYENMYKKNHYDGYLEKIRDLKVFDKYDFIETKD